MKKYLCYSDTHLNFTFPWTQYDFAERIIAEEPAGLFLNGDIACGITLPRILSFLAKKIQNIPIYFVVGNHDHYSFSINRTTEVLRKLCGKHKNLIWLTDQDVIQLNEETALIGEDNWYDARVGSPIYLNYNFDWVMIDDFRKLSSFTEKLDLSRQLADQYTARLKIKLDKALEKYKTYILNNESLLKDIHELDGKVLGCWCSPKPCHGDVLVEILQSRRFENSGGLFD